MFSKIYKKSICLYVCDISNFEGSLDQEVLTEIEKGKHTMIFIANKIDALPKGFTIERVQNWVRDQLKKRISKELLDDTIICCTSARQVTGIPKVLDCLHKLKNKSQNLKFRPKVYVIGTTNSGKSSLINAMIKK